MYILGCAFDLVFDSSNHGFFSRKAFLYCVLKKKTVGFASA